MPFAIAVSSLQQYRAPISLDFISPPLMRAITFAHHKEQRERAFYNRTGIINFTVFFSLFVSVLFFLFFFLVDAKSFVEMVTFRLFCGNNGKSKSSFVCVCAGNVIASI